MFSFKVLNGIHSDEEGNVYTVGQVVKSALPLDKMFAGRFERLTDAPVNTTARPTPARKEVEVPPAEEEVAEPEEASEEGDDSPVGSKFGDDVTSLFPDAEPGGLKVFRDGNLFSIVDAEEPDVCLESVKGKGAAVKAVSKNVKN